MKPRNTLPPIRHDDRRRFRVTLLTIDNLPEGVTSDARVVLFDGVCNLCNGWAQFLIARDPRGKLRLASVQSCTGAAMSGRS